MDAEEKKVKIYSYRKVWRVEKKIYALQNIRLPFPVNPYEVLEFIAVAIVVLAAGYVFPPFERVPTVLRFIAIPYFTTQYLMKKRLDGKNPLKYFLGCMVYSVTAKGKYLERMKSYSSRPEKCKLSWNCSVGCRKTD